MATRQNKIENDEWDNFVKEVKEKCSRQGREYKTVSHPDPKENIIDAEWKIEVKTGSLFY